MVNSMPLPPAGPRGLPVFGHLPLYFKDGPAMYAKLAQGGDVVSFKLGRESCVLINRADLIEALLRNRKAVRSVGTRRVLSAFLGNGGLLTLEGTNHLQHRRLMAPAFHRERIREYGEQMSREVYRTISGWRAGSTIDMRGEMMKLTYRIVSEALFSGSASHSSTRVGHALEQLLPWAMAGGALSRLLPASVPVLYPPHARRATHELMRVVIELAAERRRQGNEGADLMSMLIAARDEDGSQLDDAEVASEALTLLLAGHETTANTLSWAWYLLTQHPEQQRAVAAEVAQVVGDGPVQPGDLAKLPLVDQVIRETLRLYPTAWVGDRVPEQDTEMGGYRVKAGTPIHFCTYVLHRDPRYFPEPERFDPARFSPERSADLVPGSYLPFGIGVHQCIGNAFASMEARIVLAAMAQHFEVRQVPRHRVRPRALITLGMADAFPVRLEKARSSTSTRTQILAQHTV